MKQRFTIWAFLSAVLTLAGCSGVKVQDYQNQNPDLKIEEYFQGQTQAWGIFQDRFGKVRRRFVVDIDGQWDTDLETLTLTENFDYDDGQKEQRIWTIKKTGPESYIGTADKVVGNAIGQSAGNAFNFKYTFDLPVEDKTWRVQFDDWMYLQDRNVLFNKATIKRWGIRLGDVYIFFDKRGK